MAYVTHTLGALDFVSQDAKFRVLGVSQLIRNRPRDQISFQNGADSGDLLAYSAQRSDSWPFALLIRGTSSADLHANVGSVQATLASAVAYQTTLSGSPVDYVYAFGDSGTITYEVVRFDNYREDWTEMGFNRVRAMFDLVLTQQ